MNIALPKQRLNVDEFLAWSLQQEMGKFELIAGMVIMQQSERRAQMGQNMNTKDDRSADAPRRWLWGPVSGLGLLVMLATVAVDQADKWWMLLVYDIKTRGRVSVLPFLDLVYAKNTGVSYGLLVGIGQNALAGFAAAVVLSMAWWLARNTSRLVAWGLGFIMGGALGNAIDRITMGGVADFFQLHAFGYSWYVFNIADTAIVAGVILLLYDSLVVSRKSAANSP